MTKKKLTKGDKMVAKLLKKQSGYVFPTQPANGKYKGSEVCSIEGAASIHGTLFVFSIDGPKQNATSLLTPVSNIVFNALSSGTLGFALHGSFNNHLHERI